MKPPETARPDAASRPPRKRYEKPTLERYGDLTEISKTIANQTLQDGQNHPNKHFTN
jgi:hypothetical protein